MLPVECGRRASATDLAKPRTGRACYGPDVTTPSTDDELLARAAEHAPACRKALIAWFLREQRELPWRRTRDPYAVLVSELMLQQTRVDVVIPYFERFMRRFPDVRSLAAAPESAVLAAWSGLGYYRRARFLQAAARAIENEHGGRFPRDFDAILALPGVGRYTAGAIASIAFGTSVPLVDGNVARVFARWFALEGDQRSGAQQKRLWALAATVLDAAHPGDFNQSLMELGACICTPRAPRCDRCPVARWCEAKRAGEPERYPAARQRKATIDVRLAVLAAFDAKTRIAVIRRRAGTRMERMLDLPALELNAKDDASDELTRFARARWNLALANTALAGRARHTITHHRIAIEVWTARVGTARRDESSAVASTRDPAPLGIAAVADDAGIAFRAPDSLTNEAIANLARKALKIAGIHDSRE